MTKAERKILGQMAVAFGEMSYHLLNYQDMLQNEEVNLEQLEAAFVLMIEGRNKTVECFAAFKPQIKKSLEENDIKLLEIPRHIP